MSLQTSVSETRSKVARVSNVVRVPANELLGMVEELRQAVAREPQNVSEIALQFLKRIASHESAEPGVTRGGLAPWQKRKIERYLRDNLEQTIGLNELAGEAKLSVSHFCRAFKKSFGETPHAYVLRLRLELAQNLMLNTGDPLSQIALSCGLADQAHLSKLFRRAFHDTPNAWRRRNLSDAQAEGNVQTSKGGMREAA